MSKITKNVTKALENIQRTVNSLAGASHEATPVEVIAIDDIMADLCEARLRLVRLYVALKHEK